MTHRQLVPDERHPLDKSEYVVGLDVAGDVWQELSTWANLIAGSSSPKVSGPAKYADPEMVRIDR